MAEISDFINQVLDQDFANAQPTFAELIGGKMNDALEQEKIAVAGQIFNGEEPEEEIEMEAENDDIDVDDVTDEEIEDAIDELELEEVE